MKRTNIDQAGFALLEVIVAMAIASFALAVIYRTIGDGLRNAARVQLLQSTVIAARSQLDAVASDGLVAPGRSEGRYQNGIRWQMNIADLSSQPKDATKLRPYWIALEALDVSGRQLLRLESAKLAREVQP